MAALTTTQVVTLHIDGDALKLVTYRVVGTSSGDTWNTATQLAKALQATWYQVSNGSATTAVISANTTVTIPAGAAVDSGYLVVFGESAV